MFDFLDLMPDADALLTEARREGVTLFGAGNFALAVRDALRSIGISVRACVVSEVTSRTCGDVPVVTLDTLDAAASALPLWVAVYNRSANADLIAIATCCRARGIARVRLPQEYYAAIQQQLGWRFWLNDLRQYASARASIESAYRLLDDEKSRQQFLTTLRFRLALPMEVGPSPTDEPQYFPGAIHTALATRQRGCVFVDGGAYDGDTIVQATATIPLTRAYAFEPDLVNFSRLAANVAALDIPVISYPCGLSNATEWLAFASDNGEASAIATDGNNRIQCVRLDECLIGERIDYIKFDVEGHELPALAGASGIIRRDRPVLAIAAYHRWDDIWRIPKFIRGIVPEYRIRYRTHEHNTFESVFYAYC
ncbi:MAG: FkbM family methyltransferase [Chromatiaceae bacterium]